MSNDTERWLPVVGYEGYYEVSDRGRVRSLDRWVSYGKNHRASHLPGRVLLQRARPDGRHEITLWRQGQKRVLRVSVLVLEAFIGPRPAGEVCCHADGNAGNNKVANLRWDTSTANRYDSVLHGTHPSASRTHCPRGHLLSSPNLVAAKARKGHRNCLACDRAKANQRHAERLGRAYDFTAGADAHYLKITRPIGGAQR